MSEAIQTRQATDEEKARYGELIPNNLNRDGIAEKKPFNIDSYKNHITVTKEFVLAEFAKGKTVLKIEKDQGMKANTLYKRLSDWGIRSPHSPNYKKSENETSSRQPANSLPSKRPPVAYRRKMNTIDRITGDVTTVLIREMRNNPAFYSADQGYAVVFESLIKARAAIKDKNLVLAEFEMQRVAAMAIRFILDLTLNKNEVTE